MKFNRTKSKRNPTKICQQCHKSLNGNKRSARLCSECYLKYLRWVDNKKKSLKYHHKKLTELPDELSVDEYIMDEDEDTPTQLENQSRHGIMEVI